MWAPKAFNDDDPRNKVLADEMGVVMGSSHHEPMTRAQAEWHRNTDKGVTGGRWDYATNGDNLRAFWRGGIERMMSKGDGTPYESLVTVGMRGDGDEPMAEGAATQLLEKVVADQRKIIAEVTGKPPEKTPQVWALYKEVQDYYDHGMRVPDDVTLLFSDDNWGQIRRLPVARRGGTRPARSGRRLRRLLPLRLCGRAAELQVDQHQPGGQDLAADEPGLRARGAEPVDRQCRRHQAAGISAGFLHAHGLEPRGDDAPGSGGLSPPVGQPDLRRGAGSRDRRGHGDLRPTPRAASPS
jgi:hypothetical protein